MMKVGLTRPHGDPGLPRNDLDMGLIAQLAEEVGFDWLTYGHHTVRPLNEPIVGPHEEGVPLHQDPLVGAARATAMTTRIEVATGVLVMPMKHPVDVAKQVASIDLYSDGRFLLGLGTGGASRQEIETSGGRWARRWDYTLESIDIMCGLWTQDSFEYTGEFFEVPPVVMGPRPIQRPHPPLMLGGVTDRVLKYVGERAQGWMPAYLGTKVFTLDGIDPTETGPDNVRAGRATIEAYARDAGRDVPNFEIGVLIVVSENDDVKQLLRMYEEAGADRISFSLPPLQTIEGARVEIERYAELLL